MSTAHAIPRLGAVLKLERVAPLTAEALADLWHSRAALKPNTVAAVSSADALRLIHSRLQLCPNFILPVSKMSGQDIFFIQGHTDASHDCGNFSLHATDLAQFQRLGPTAATPKASFSFFREMAASKNIGLISGTFDDTTLNRQQCALLLASFCRAYTDSAFFDRWVRGFHEQPHAFNFDAYLLAVNELQK